MCSMIQMSILFLIFLSRVKFNTVENSFGKDLYINKYLKDGNTREILMIIGVSVYVTVSITSINTNLNS